MKPYIVSYDLDKPGQNYEKLIIRLKTLGAVRILYSQWVLASRLTAIQLRDDLKPLIDSNDRLLVCAVTGEWASFNLMAAHKFKEITA